jgi:hypothetical protein
LTRSVEGDRHQWLALDLGDEWFRLLGVPSGTVDDDRFRGSQLAEDTDGLDEYRSQITGPGQVPIGAHERVAAQGAGDDKAVFGQSGDLAACGCLSDPRPLGELTDRALFPRLGEEAPVR